MMRRRIQMARAGFSLLLLDHFLCCTDSRALHDCDKPISWSG